MSLDFYSQSKCEVNEVFSLKEKTKSFVFVQWEYGIHTQ